MGFLWMVGSRFGAPATGGRAALGAVLLAARGESPWQAKPPAPHWPKSLILLVAQAVPPASAP
jgi:hypothetical protein